MKAQPRALRVSLSRARHTLGTLCFGTIVCVGMLAARCLRAHNMQSDYLGWNLFLAWIPAVLALAVWLMRAHTWWRRLLSGLAILLWILFFPNAFYIVTDYIHSGDFGTAGVPIWFDIMLTSAYACAGMFLGSLSLYLMHLLVRERFGWRVGWLFAATMLAIGSVGIYMGRFWRLNSWDLLYRPMAFVSGIGRLIISEIHNIIPFSVTFFFFSLVVYCFVVSMARLHEDEVEREKP